MRMNSKNSRKYRHETAVPVNITLPPLLHQKLFEMIRARGFSGPSDYIQNRIRLDSGLGLVAHEHEQEKAA